MVCCTQINANGACVHICRATVEQILCDFHTIDCDCALRKASCKHTAHTHTHTYETITIVRRYHCRRRRRRATEQYDKYTHFNRVYLKLKSVVRTRTDAVNKICARRLFQSYLATRHACTHIQRHRLRDILRERAHTHAIVVHVLVFATDTCIICMLMLYTPARTDATIASPRTQPISTTSTHVHAVECAQSQQVVCMCVCLLCMREITYGDHDCLHRRPACNVI